MTQEEKQLLLKDLCARLPYKVKVKSSRRTVVTALTLDIINDFYLGCDVKPYLRSMSSMTEEEFKDLQAEHDKDEKLFTEAFKSFQEGDTSMRGKIILHYAADWCNRNHFDYRGLIPMGLALEAPEGMYKTE